MGVGDAAGVDHPAPQAVQDPQPVQDCNRRQNHQGFAQVKENVDKADPLGVRSGPDIAHDGGGHAVAQVDAHQNGIDGAEGELPGGGKGLQDSDGGRRALQHEGHSRADQIAQEGILPQPGEEQLDNAAVGEGAHRVGHIQESGKENAEAGDDLARRA